MMKYPHLLLLSLLSGALYAAPIAVGTLDYPPYVCGTDAQARGPAPALVAALLGDKGEPFVTHVRPWARTLSEVKEGLTDAIYPLLKTPERLAFLRYPDTPLFVEEVVLVGPLKRIRALSGSIKDVEGIRLCVAREFSLGAEIDELLRKRKTTRIDENTSLACIKNLQHGIADFYATDRLTALSGVRLWANSGEFAITKVSYASVPSYFAVRAGGALASRTHEIDAAIQHLKASGRYQTIIDEHLHDCDAVDAR